MYQCMYINLALILLYSHLVCVCVWVMFSFTCTSTVPLASVKPRDVHFFCMCVPQRSPAERQPVWDHHKLPNLLHSGKTSFCRIQHLKALFLTNICRPADGTTSQRRGLFCYCELRGCFPRCIRLDVLTCLLETLCCWCVTWLLFLELEKLVFVKRAQPSVTITTTMSSQ